MGNCGTVYELTSKVLRVDTTSFWETRNDLGNLQIKGQRHFEKDAEGNFNSKKLSIPLIMLLEPRTIFGCPDCHDQGGYYLEFTLLGIRRHFEIDKGSGPIYFRSLTKDIDKEIDQIYTEFIK